MLASDCVGTARGLRFSHMNSGHVLYRDNGNENGNYGDYRDCLGFRV